ncbi:MAG: histidine phosphatase family protein [bacterium]|nr:histidine phosphatase family protein [bacterium]
MTSAEKVEKSSATRELILLRHAKSTWDTDTSSDLGRPLAKRGKRDSLHMGRWLKDCGLVPDLVLSSPANRTQQTAVTVLEELESEPDLIHSDERLYLGDLEDLLAVLKDCPAERARVLIVGHSPGLEQLTTFLVGEPLELPPVGKTFPTGAAALLRLPEDWSDLRPGAAQLIALMRPRALPKT